MKRTLSLGFLSIIMTVLSNVMILPAAYHFLSPSQVALWFNYITLYSLILLLDFGITTSIARSFARAWCGQNHVDISDQTPDWIGFAALFRVSKKIYGHVALFSMLVAACLATPYLLYISESDSDFRDVLYSWPIYGVGIFLSIRQIYFMPALRGMSEIGKVYSANIIAKLAQVIITVMLFYIDVGIVSVSLGFVASAIMSRTFLSRFFLRAVQGKLSRADLDGERVGDKELRSDLVPKVIKQGFISLANFFQDKAALFYISAFAGLESSSKYGLTIQVMGLAASAGNVYYNTVQAKLIEGHVRGNGALVKKYIITALLSQTLVISLGGFVIWGVGSKFLGLLQMDGAIVDAVSLSLIVLYLMIFNWQLICANYLLIRGDFSMLWPYVISAISFVLVVSLSATDRKMDMQSILVIQLATLLAFNAWRWPWKTVKALAT